jgi:hypothetical protein
VAELFNTSIERLTNLVSPEHHPLAKQVKDYAAGAVLVRVGAILTAPFIRALARDSSMSCIRMIIFTRNGFLRSGKYGCENYKRSTYRFTQVI